MPGWGPPKLAHKLEVEALHHSGTASTVSFACMLPAALCSGAPLRTPLCLQSKVQLYVNRFHLVQQRLKRNKLFRAAQASEPAPAQWGRTGLLWGSRQQ
jgi:hypothetical protein